MKRNAECHDHDKRLASELNVNSTKEDYRLNMNAVNDQIYSTQAALGLSTKCNLPAKHSDIDDHF